MWQDDSDATKASSGSTASFFESGGGTTLGELDAGTVTAPSNRHSWPREYLLSVNAASPGRVQITVAVYVLMSDFKRGAGEGNRTLVTWLGTKSSTIALHPPEKPILCGQPSARQRDKLALMILGVLTIAGALAESFAQASETMRCGK